MSLAGYSTQNVTLVLAAFAQLALAEGDLERAALLAGAVEGLRRRAGVAVWPAVRREEADLAAQLRQALGADRFRPGLRRRSPAQPPRRSGRRPRERTGTRASSLMSRAGQRVGSRHWCAPVERRAGMRSWAATGFI